MTSLCIFNTDPNDRDDDTINFDEDGENVLRAKTLVSFQ